LETQSIEVALIGLETEGVVMRGSYTGQHGEEWCERRLLARIHRYTLKRLRSEIQPVTLAEFQKFLFHWHGLGNAQREGAAALSAVLSELQGAVLPAAVWERAVLPARIADYGGDLLDQLSVSGEVVWWRPRLRGSAAKQTVAASPIAIVPRSFFPVWQLLAEQIGADDQQVADLSSQATRVLEQLQSSGALFFLELVMQSGLLRTQVEDALGELVARGLVTADSFNGLRALIRPQSKRPRFGSRHRGAHSEFDAAGRWAQVLRWPSLDMADGEQLSTEAIEHAAMSLLRRYGVISRAIVMREDLAPAWRDLARFYRRAEARGEIRGGRFVEPFGGEQFALIDAVDSLRRIKRDGDKDEWLAVSAADPAQLSSLVGESVKVPQIAANRIAFRDGVPIAAVTGAGFHMFDHRNAQYEARARNELFSDRSARPGAGTSVRFQSRGRRR
jgi:ATP-dependent Lhr-like helicase